MQDGLFRDESLETRHAKSLGVVRIGLPRFTRRVSIVGVLASSALLAFVFAASYTRRDHVSGQLLPSNGLLTIAATSGGVIKRLLVNDGDKVEQGQPLLEISTEIDGAQAGSIASAIAQQLQLQRKHLNDDLQDLLTSTRQDIADAKGRIVGLQSELAIATSQCLIREKQLDRTRNVLETLRPLAKAGQISRLEFGRQESLSLDAEAQIESSALQKMDAQRRLDAARDELARLPVKHAERQRDIERRIADVDQGIARNDAQQSVMIKAPRRGTISGMTADSGKSVTAGDRLLALIPDDSPLQAELWVSSHDIGFISPGKDVVLRYHAYPYERFGQQFGHVREVAGSALTPSEALHLTGQRFSTPVYRVLVELETQSLQMPGRSLPLRANMTLDADILLERRRLIDWLLTPSALGEPPDHTAHDIADGQSVRHKVVV